MVTSLSIVTSLVWLTFASASPHVLVRRALPSNWTAQGCWKESSNGRALQGSSYVNSTSMTQESCIAFCASGGFNYAGAEYGSECYCGNFFLGDSNKTTTTDCNMACAGNSTELCGAGNRLTVFWNGKNATQPVTNPGPSGWHSVGCYSDSVNARTLPTGQNVPGGASNMTVGGCVTACANAGYSLAGVEYAAECYCANALGKSATLLASSSCGRPCNGNSSEYCGGANALNVYQVGPAPTSSSSPSATAASTTSSTARTSPGSGSSSAITSSITSSSTKTTTTMPTSTKSSVVTSSSSTATNTSSTASLTSTSTTAMTTSSVPSTSSTVSSSGTTSSLTTSATTSTSSSTSFSTISSTISSTNLTSSTKTLANTTSSSATTASTTTVPTTSSASSTPTSVTCNASNNTVFTTPNGATFIIECGIDRAGGDMAGGAPYTSTFTTCVNLCASTSGCVDLSYFNSYCYMKAHVNGAGSNSGVQGARLLTAATSNSSPSSSYSSSSSTQPSSTTSKATTSGSMSASSTVSTTSAATSSATSSANISLPAGWVYKGCWVDNAHGRILINNIKNDNGMTIEMCVNACAQAGYPIAGIEYSTQCSCGSQVIQAGTLANQDSDCAMTCGGNSNEICGGPNRMSLYSNGTITVLPVPTPQNTSLPGSWQYVGCMTDGANNNQRALPWKLILPTNNSAATCLSQCSAFGYPVAGMEYGEECYCGDQRDLTTGLSVSALESDCNTACPGNGSYLCGAGNRLSLYKWTGTPLYQFNYATGNAAGSYEYFVPGVVVPLITVPGKNGKITFVEKFGTSEFGNSTGAYELDPSLASDFSECWRTMTGIKTDVFCSAGLILPDAGARQINIGGWSADSLYGVRFYTPDGAPGINSTNMWEENVNAIALQAPRWYPSAMMMTNGSILIVGGEDGSNGVPTPSLELLPPAGPALYCDWLKQSDPNNLYPFLFVLPSSGIFVSYWNQARILDPITLLTRRLLPQLPGSVIEPLSGRTYPFEGTAVLLPQSAPYTDPLTVLICGGSGPGASIALDNCVSIAPDVPNATWTLERMPSKRVLSCMVSLPDGTFLILNGAQQGVAGFGLAENPNLNAVLYDPAKPIGARMTIMANTTIPRLYHNEAVLMDDGRVLVSGSDPQSPEFPEEMRVEVFNPPYILDMNAATRLAFTLDNGRESYGYSDTISVTLTNAAAGAVARVSLLAAVASTHGNSMGQRTIFPAFSCSGSKCSITTPPNANVSPPAWFQMFLVDANGTPSWAKWVRIGGDPGGVGEWPQGAGFTRPGS